MKYTAGPAAGKIFSGDSWKRAPDAYPTGLLFKRNRKFKDKKAKSP
jgi:hypothetical protein